MKKYTVLFIIVAVITFFSCEKGESGESGDSDKIVISGTFQKVVQGQNMWIERMDGKTAEVKRHVKFVPDDTDKTEESMYCVTDDDGKFKVSLIRGMTYHAWVDYYTNQAVEGQIKFNDTLGSQIDVPADAPDSVDLGTLYITKCAPYGAGSTTIYIAEKSLPWLTETIDLTGNTSPTVTVSGPVIYDNNTGEQFGFRQLKYTADAADADGDNVYYNWFLSTTDESASVVSDILYIRRAGDVVDVYLHSADSHGTLTLIVTDSRGGSVKKVQTF